VPLESIFGFSGELDTRFENLYVVGDIWSDHLMHPAAADWMRHAVKINRPPAGIRRLAVARIASAGRNMDNWAKVESVLIDHGFTTVATGTLSFADQVAIFQSAETVFGTLGSDLVNLIFSPKGVRVIAAAPAEFGDRFFYAIVLDREGYLADVRGPVTQMNDEMYSKSRFVLGLDDLKNALRVLDSENKAGPMAT
jgi:capsular polysaccharide biosynthesis protein